MIDAANIDCFCSPESTSCQHYFVEKSGDGRGNWLQNGEQKRAQQNVILKWIKNGECCNDFRSPISRVRILFRNADFCRRQE